MHVEHVNTPDAPPAGGAYSQAVRAGGFLYTAGMGPHDPRTGEVVRGGIIEQTAQVLRNLRSILADSGLDFTDVVKVTTHLSDLHRDFADYDTAFRSMVPSPYPARTTVGSCLWHILVEIDVVAKLRSE